jgi:hypothetical protein
LKGFGEDPVFVESAAFDRREVRTRDIESEKCIVRRRLLSKVSLSQGIEIKIDDFPASRCGALGWRRNTIRVQGYLNLLCHGSLRTNLPDCVFAKAHRNGMDL